MFLSSTGLHEASILGDSYVLEKQLKQWYDSLRLNLNDK